MNAATGTTSTGDKVTLAVLSHQIMALTTLQKEQHKEVIDEIRAIKIDVHEMDNEQCTQAEKIAGIVKDITDNIKPAIKRDTWLSGIAVVLGTLATALLTWLGLK